MTDADAVRGWDHRRRGDFIRTARRTHAQPRSNPSARSCWSAPARWARAMLEGWLARGLDPKKLVVIEPQPSKAIKALARRGLTLNPKGKAAAAARHRDRGEAADRGRGGAAARALCRQGDAGALDHGRAHPRLPAKNRCRPTRHRARHAQHAGRDRPRHHRRGRQRQGVRAPAQARRRSARRHRQGRMGRATRR